METELAIAIFLFFILLEDMGGCFRPGTPESCIFGLAKTMARAGLLGPNLKAASWMAGLHFKQFK